MNNTCLLIPALEPQEHFIDYVKKLKQIPHLHIVVVNDDYSHVKALVVADICTTSIA